MIKLNASYTQIIITFFLNKNLFSAQNPHKSDHQTQIKNNQAHPDEAQTERNPIKRATNRARWNSLGIALHNEIFRSTRYKLLSPPLPEKKTRYASAAGEWSEEEEEEEEIKNARNSVYSRAVRKIDEYICVYVKTREKCVPADENTFGRRARRYEIPSAVDDWY